ncbi:MAG: HAD-IIB family hydrolase [Gammaproteobacteria bacterium]|nr:HAD-IIB family hydrolase [Gammaproteobacteria bacterium]
MNKYLLLISIHGLIRGHDLELGCDADTGGQTKYVVDLARALASSEGVGQVDLVTRRIVDPLVSDDYQQPIEALSDNARIIRIDAGPEEYIPKEQLWDHLDSFMDNLVNWLNGQEGMPDLVHSHYADAGYVGIRLSSLLGVPLIHTGHSLGRDKRKRLLAKGLSREAIEQTYNIERRIDAEEEVLANADLIITSTRNEIREQYALYNYYDPGRMVVIPPGTDLQQFHPYDGSETIAFFNEVSRFFTDPDKPIILSLSRPDERKNILTLIEAYGESSELQQLANLLVIAGTREDIRDLDKGAQEVLTNILLLMDSYDLYGKMAIPKGHHPEEVPEIYRLAAATRGVFVNPALTEPFGLTLLEAAASGLPIVATENGGPVDIIGNCHNGRLVDPLDKEEITRALLDLLGNQDSWSQASRNGIQAVRQYYSWRGHADSYLSMVLSLAGKYQPIPSEPPRAKTLRYRDRAIFTDLDQNLVGDSAVGLRQFVDVMQENHRCVTFGIATGRRIDTALSLMNKYGIPRPDVLISSLGTRIHYGQSLTEDDYWADHIDHHWNLRRVKRLLDELPGLKVQPKKEQTQYKLSYYYDVVKAPPLEEITAMLRDRELTANAISSFGQFLDIVPSRASKGQALRYVAQRFDIPLEQILVAGGSGADEDMMRGNMLAVVVANRHDEELSQLEEQSIYFASQPHAMGILEAIDHYDFFGACKVPPADD